LLLLVPCMMTPSTGAYHWLASTVRILQKRVGELESRLDRTTLESRSPAPIPQVISLHHALFADEPITSAQNKRKHPHPLSGAFEMDWESLHFSLGDSDLEDSSEDLASETSSSFYSCGGGPSASGPDGLSASPQMDEDANTHATHPTPPRPNKAETLSGTSTSSRSDGGVKIHARPSTPPRPCEAVLEEGDFVRLRGLINKPELNGAVGLAEGFNDCKGRWRISLESGDEDILVRVANLQVMTDCEIEQYFADN